MQFNIRSWTGTHVPLSISQTDLRIEWIGDPSRSLEVRTGAPIESALFAADGNHLVIDTFEDRYVARLDRQGPINHFRRRGRFNGTTSAVSAGTSDHLRVAVADLFMDSRGDAVVIDEQGSELIRLRHEGEYESIALTTDGQMVSTVSLHRGVRIWHLPEGREIARLSNDGNVVRVAFDRDGCRVASGTGKELRVFDICHRPWTEIVHDASVDSISFSPDGTLLATASSHISGRGGVRVFDVRSGLEFLQLLGHCCGSSVRFSPSGEFVAAVTQQIEKGMTVWSVKTGGAVARIDFVPHWRQSLAFGSGDTLVAGERGDSVSQILTWKPPLFDRPPEVARLPGVLMALSPDARFAVTTTESAMHLWDTQTMRETWVTRMATEETPYRLAVSKNYVAFVRAGGENRTVEIWSFQQKKLYRQIVQDLLISGLSFSPDEQFIATASDDGTARVWNLSSGAEVARTHVNAAGAIAFSPDGRYVASGGSDHLVRIWPWRSVDLIDIACKMLPRNLTSEEWKTYLAGEAYRKSCPDLP